MQASQETFSKIIQSDNGNEHYHVPKYQRAYSWRQNNWTQIYDDIDENDPGHFIGSIICVDENNNRGPGHDRIYELIDGQQRMTTLSLILAGLFQKLNDCSVLIEANDDYDNDELDEIKAKRRGIGLQIIRKIKSDVADQRGSIKLGRTAVLLRVQPSSQNRNLDDYLYILSECGVLTEEIKCPSHFGNRLMAKAYRYFLDRLPDSIDALLLMADKINQLQLVHISVDSHSNAFRLFETLNNRGVPLTAVDIIKNKMLAEMERQHKISIDDAYELWQEMLEHIEDVEDRFLRQFYNAFKHEKGIGQPSFTSKATSSTLIAIYEKIIDKNAQFIFDELTAKAKIYGSLIQPDESTSLGKALVGLNRVGAVPSNALLMYLMTLKDENFATEGTLLTIINFLQKYFVRRNITDTPSTRDLDQLQIDVIEACEERVKTKQPIDLDFLITSYCKGRGEPASLNTFKESLANNLFYYNKQMARYVLVKLSERAHNREYQPDFRAHNNKGQYIWTVEHIFPQGENIPDHWVDMIAGGDAALAKEIQEDCVHSLGNLTLSGYNSRLSNQDFHRKQSKTEVTAAGHKINIGYKNGLYLNSLDFETTDGTKSLSNILNWSKESIESRNSKMVTLLCDQYRFDHETDNDDP
ncbi:DUF262 domain-containing protein [Hwanghaeella sp. LZ110]|uniref:DUF262 domain-containing protein n=1 Tax=Hwanghaeella sp. LZ110 TaxID=3402810 RepID=UPI003B67B4F9